VTDDTYYQQREKKEEFLEDLLKLCTKYEVLIKLETTTDLIPYSQEREEKMIKCLQWWKD